MDSIALRNALISAINTAKLPHDLQPILKPQGIEICFLRGGTLQEIEAFTIKAQNQTRWQMSDEFGPDLAWQHLSAKKGWKHNAATGLSGTSLATDITTMRPPTNKIETVLDLLVEQITALAAVPRQLITKVINSFLIYSEKTFKATLPRLTETQLGVKRVSSSLEVQIAPSADCISQTSRHLLSLLDGIQARDPGRIALPISMSDMAEIHQALRDLEIQESKSPSQILQEQEAMAQVEWSEAKKYWADCKRERWDIVAMVNGYSKGKRIIDPKEKRQLLADADAKVREAERKVELAESKFPQLWHDPDGDAQLLHIEQHRG